MMEKNNPNSFIRHKWEGRGRCGGVGGKKKENKTRITKILTNKRIVVLQTKVNNGLLRQWN